MSCAISLPRFGPEKRKPAVTIAGISVNKDWITPTLSAEPDAPAKSLLARRAQRCAENTNGRTTSLSAL
jgi:hypothetical protein